MHSSSLIKLLSKFNKEEWKRFDKFVRSPYFNSNKSVIQLFELLKKYAPDFTSSKLKKEKISQKIFRNTVYKEKRMWQLMSDLKGLAEQFLVVEKNDKTSTTYQVQLNEVFFEKDLFDWFEQKSANLTTKLAHNGSLINQFYLHQINDDAYYNNHSLSRQPNHPNLTDAHTHLHYYYHLQELRYACEWKSRSNRIVENPPLFIQAITYRQQYANQPLYSLYYDVFILFSEKETAISFLKNLIVKLKNHIDDIPKKHQITIILYLINYSGKKIQSSEDAYLPILFELYKLGFENKRLVYKDTLSETSFMNTVGTGCQLKEFDWVHQFIQEFHQYLPKDAVTTSLIWAKAFVYMEQEEFTKALQMVSHINFNTDIKELTRRSMELRACLGSMVKGDNSYYELLRNKSLSFEKYLQRKEGITANKKVNFIKLNRIIRALAKLIYEKASTSKLIKFYQEVEQMEKLAVKSWLLTQIQKVRFGRRNHAIPPPEKVFT